MLRQQLIDAEDVFRSVRSRHGREVHQRLLIGSGGTVAVLHQHGFEV